MIELSKSQYKMLRRANKGNLVFDKLNDNEVEICEYLVLNDCLACNRDVNDGIFCHTVITSYSITQRGRAQLLEFTFKYHRWYIPLIISVLSLIISAMAYFNPRN